MCTHIIVMIIMIMIMIMIMISNDNSNNNLGALRGIRSVFMISNRKISN